MALSRGGEAVENPIAWFDALPDRVSTIWEAYYQIEPWGGEVEAERFAALMELMDALLASSVNPNVPASRSDLLYKPRSREDFMPPAAVDAVEAKRAKLPKGDIVSQLDSFVAAVKARG